ncbi:hypothetical protein SNOG_05646 [Parastagonospora nodorum SN15]|uniref:General negative regulator of transcription subunit n=1 Tax=Phaeosphaeria nodorum (strain SN15 / ATCC MYA-4574 / FGSC 10173) TaxID=321614 RepID=Q0URG8_PHANO|nr:hypothetical protein SNOG_05646 [Parastagonospora nodorum SN15]EAT86710.2 hypothetical protein SNOG_05646 [Parastagonospora nodorum SN15]
MAARKLQQEIDKCFKKVAEGVATFESIYEKIMQTGNPSQKEKLEDQLKKEIKKLQRSRDQIKTWAAMSEIKDKKPLLDHRKLIETPTDHVQQMERFKAVEKEMKTKAYSKEGLQLASKIDPKDKERMEVVEFLQHMNEELERQIETLEAEAETMQVVGKKSKKADASKAERIAEMEETVERHRWHQTKLELLQRALENSSIDTEQVKEIEESIKYYVEENQSPDFMDDDTIYDELNLQEEEVIFGMGGEMDRVSSQDTQSIQDETPELEGKPSAPETQGRRTDAVRRAKTVDAAQVSITGVGDIAYAITWYIELSKHYASAAAAAAASDKNGVGIAPLPPPPGGSAAPSGLAPAGARASASTSPATTHPKLAQTSSEQVQPAQARSPAATPSHPVTAAVEKEALSRAASAEDAVKASRRTPAPERLEEEGSQAATPPLTNGDSHAEDEEEESVYHLPSSLQDLLDSFEATKNEINASVSKPPDERMLASSMATAPDSADTEAPRHYQPQNPYPFTPAHYPQEPLPIFDDPRLYQRIETDALFYAFYYQQGSFQQYLAAKALKSQSWRFHKQYQTWFQRHEEPKAITEDYEQGTYRFFDYESTW